MAGTLSAQVRTQVSPFSNASAVLNGQGARALKVRSRAVAEGDMLESQSLQQCVAFLWRTERLTGGLSGLSG